MALLLKRKKRFPRLLQSPPVEEGYEEERRYFTGPLGVWPWPIVNLILAFVDLLRSQAEALRSPAYRLPRTATRRTEYIRDEKGRIIEKYEEVTLE